MTLAVDMPFYSKSSASGDPDKMPQNIMLVVVAMLQTIWPFCHLANSVRALEGKIYKCRWFAHPRLTREGLPSLSLTTKGFWLPCNRVDKALVGLCKTVDLGL